MPVRPAPFTFANVGDVRTIATSDTVNFVDDVTNNPLGYTYLFYYVTTAGNISFQDTNDVARTLTAVPVFTIIPVPMKRVNTTSTTAAGIAIIPK